MNIRNNAVLAAVVATASIISTHGFIINSNHVSMISSSLGYQQQLESISTTTILEASSDDNMTMDIKTDMNQREKLDEFRAIQKKKLLGLLNTNSYTDPVLADPLTKESLMITQEGAILGGLSSSSTKGSTVSLKSKTSTYKGRTDTYYNLIAQTENIDEENDDNDNQDTTTPSSDSSSNKAVNETFKSLQVFIPPPLRSTVSKILPVDDYVPMRDLFTSPTVSFAYERGWRQGFAAAGFPGPDKEYEMVRDYFKPLNPEVVVDMSCATGLFTRRLAKSNDYARVIGCDYSEAMLLEARSRIQSDPDLSNITKSSQSGKRTNLNLVRCDVGNIPMKTESVDALHAGAAMHCWPDLESALSEIHRVLKPGGRYFATTFLSSYFRGIQQISGNNSSIQEQAFQFFPSTEFLLDLLLKAGFEESKVKIEVLGTSCVVIRAEK